MILPGLNKQNSIIRRRHGHMARLALSTRVEPFLVSAVLFQQIKNKLI